MDEDIVSTLHESVSSIYIICYIYGRCGKSTKILIKEVADVTFYELGDAGIPTNPVLYLDTLKVSTIEQTAETTEARGGKGNAPLIVWDFGKEINVTLEDALFSAKSMAIMFGDGTVKSITNSTEISGTQLIMKTEQFTATSSSSTTPASTDWKNTFTGPDGLVYEKLNAKFYDENGNSTTTFTANNKYFCTYDVAVDGKVIEISANTFPGTYYITGDTFARSEANGKDEFFQFIILKAKVTSENTITLEAEGDPSVFNMSLRVLRGEGGDMMKLVKYKLEGGQSAATADTATLIHNHKLTGNGKSLVELEATTSGKSNTVEGLVSTDQAIFDKDVIDEVSLGAGTITITAVTGAEPDATSPLTIFDKDGKYKGAYTVKVVSGL